MKLLLLPFFVSTLLLKNVFSWTRIAFEAFAFPVSVVILLLVNLFFGYSLYQTYRQYELTQNKLQAARQRFDQQRQFWNDLAHDVPGHQLVKAAQKTLAE